MGAKKDLPFRDLNKNGRLDPYEDARLPIAERVDDLLAQMTLEEKAGLMFHTIIPVGQDGSLVEEATPFGPHGTSHFIGELLMNHFNVHQLPTSRLGIPVTLSSDPLCRLPTIVVIDLDRPAVIPEIAQSCAGLLATFGANDSAVLDVIFGRLAPPAANCPLKCLPRWKLCAARRKTCPTIRATRSFPLGLA